MRILTSDDFTETYAKLVQRGSGFLVSKLRLSGTARTRSAFDNSAINASNWWLIPHVRRRWNKLITGNEDLIYEDYLVRKYFSGRKDIQLLSLGSGSCSHELRLAAHPCFGMITCVDFAENLLEKAKQHSIERGLQNISFLKGDAHNMEIREGFYDVIFFHASLHHFKAIDKLIGGKLCTALKYDGILVINEYVGPNRLQFPSSQIKAVNQALGKIPNSHRKRFQLGINKKKVSGPGIIRTYIADPSEARESGRILETVDKYFDRVEVKPYGGNILMLALKDIAHHFMDDTPESQAILQQLFDFEDNFLAHNESDFIFGVYRKKKR